VNGRMISAELLRVRRNRALVIWMLIMTAGAVTLFFLVAQGFHLNNSAQNGPAGGATNFRHPIVILSVIGGIAAAILGTSVGVGDLSSGVFRDLVVTGKSRSALFSARVPGMLLFWIPLIAFAYAVAIAFDFAFAGGLATPGITELIKDGLWIEMVTSIALIAAMGISSIIGSRGISIGILLAWQLAVTPLILNLSVLGVVREGLLTAATTRVEPSGLAGDRGGPNGAAASLHISLEAAILVLALWVAVPLAAGCWRTATRDA
jgi:hypothetical protein